MAEILVPPPNSPVGSNHEWNEWFFKVWTKLNNIAGVAFSYLDFTGSNITSIETRRHDDLQLIAGGNVTEKYHITAAEAAQVTANSHNATNGLQGGNSTERYHLTASQQASVATQQTKIDSLPTVNGLIVTGMTTGTTVGAAGAATALPATPLGYLTISVNGTSVKIPYYNV